MEIVIPKVTERQVGMIAARSTGQIITQISNAAQINPRQNDYLGRIDAPPERDEPLFGRKTAFGTPVWVEITFGSVTYLDNAGNTVTTPKVSFQSILVDISFPRNIVKTEIVGRNGTVKEYIGEGDAQITFRGVIVGQNGHYPQEQLAEMMNVIKAPVAIPVFSIHLQTMGIDSVVFEERSFQQEQGGYSYQAFSVQAISDTPHEIQISAI